MLGEFSYNISCHTSNSNSKWFVSILLVFICASIFGIKTVYIRWKWNFKIARCINCNVQSTFSCSIQKLVRSFDVKTSSKKTATFITINTGNSDGNKVRTKTTAFCLSLNHIEHLWKRIVKMHSKAYTKFNVSWFSRVLYIVETFYRQTNNKVTDYMNYIVLLLCTIYQVEVHLLSPQRCPKVTYKRDKTASKVISLWILIHAFNVLSFKALL